ncbi:MAG: T9SS type A sorting domain-containing protein [Saprospiraceae bacterium]|nr:T9SS type A sorting domain-containing protein [Candidatus Vicinibacter affinis]
MTIYDFQGRSVVQINNKEEIADAIEIHSLNSGIYFLHLEFADNSSYVHKFYK